VTKRLNLGHARADYIIVDPMGGRLYGLGDAVIDVNTDTVMGHVAGGGGGYAIAADENRGFVRNGVLFDLKTLAVTGHVDAKGDGIRYDPFTHRAFTSFHTINAWGKLKDYTLVHELTHVWQYEKAGAIYMAQAVHAQISRGRGAYDYGGPAGLQAARTKGQGLTGFNREEQAQIVEDFYRIKNGIPPHVPGGTTSDLPLYAHFVKTVSTLTESQLLA